MAGSSTGLTTILLLVIFLAGFALIYSPDRSHGAQPRRKAEKGLG